MNVLKCLALILHSFFFFWVHIWNCSHLIVFKTFLKVIVLKTNLHSLHSFCTQNSFALTILICTHYTHLHSNLICTLNSLSLITQLHSNLIASNLIALKYHLHSLIHFKLKTNLHSQLICTHNSFTLKTHLHSNLICTHN